jgi:hypothetical protein
VSPRDFVCNGTLVVVDVNDEFGGRWNAGSQTLQGMVGLL